MSTLGAKISNLSQAQKQHLARRLKAVQTQSKWNAYYSRVRFTADSFAVASSTFGQYTINSGHLVSAFSYNRNQDMASAGLAGTVSTLADTNLTTPYQTVAGEQVLVMGIGIFVLGQSDASFWKQLDQCVSVTLKLNGSIAFYCGIPSMLPGPGGLYGFSEAGSVAPPLANQLGFVGSITNGMPHASNYFALPEPMIWASAGSADSNFAVELKAERAMTTPVGYGLSASRGASSNIAQYNLPSASGVFADLMVVTVGCTINPLSSS